MGGGGGLGGVEEAVGSAWEGALSLVGERAGAAQVSPLQGGAVRDSHRLLSSHCSLGGGEAGRSISSPATASLAPLWLFKAAHKAPDFGCILLGPKAPGCGFWRVPQALASLSLSPPPNPFLVPFGLPREFGCPRTASKREGPRTDLVLQRR